MHCAASKTLVPSVDMFLGGWGGGGDTQTEDLFLLLIIFRGSGTGSCFRDHDAHTARDASSHGIRGGRQR